MNFYKNAATVLDHLEKHSGSVKGSLAASGINVSGGEAKRVLALVIETLKYKAILLQLLETVPLASLEKLAFPRKSRPSPPSLLAVLLHDLLFSPRKRIEASDKWPPKDAVLRHQARLRAELVRIQIRAGKSRVEELGKSAQDIGCRYVRWNPNVDRRRGGDWSLDALHRHLASKGLTRLVDGEEVWPAPVGKYLTDRHLGQEVLVFEGGTNWWNGDKWYEAGAVILQDKASCIPAMVLMDGWNVGEGGIIDATAAPGNKTSYLSALAPRASITAYERDARRFQTLEKMLSKAECRNVTCIQGDFLRSDPLSHDAQAVTRILLDPSCSGSGIVNRLDYLVDNESEEAEADDVKVQRLEKLAGFQLQMILHAFKYPSARRIVYSTCSIHPEEDEQVVMRALESREAKDRGWTLAPREEVLPSWDRRGRAEHMGGNEDLAQSVIRCLPEDHTNGFFVSCFVCTESNAAAQMASDTASRKKSAKRKREPGRVDDTAMESGADYEKLNAASSLSSEAAPQLESGSGEPAVGAGSTKTKTDAQMERLRRKKAAQKLKRRRLEAGMDAA